MKKLILRARDAVYPFTFPKAVQAAVAISSMLVATACGQVSAASKTEVKPAPQAGVTRVANSLIFSDGDVDVISISP